MKSQSPDFVSVINSPEFLNAWQAVVNDPITFSEFENMPAPSGVSSEELWSALCLMKRALGSSTGMKPWFRDIPVAECWSYIPKSVERDLFELSELVAPHSLLNIQSEQNELSLGLFADNIVEELASLAKRDGLPVSEREIRNIWVYRHPASNAYQRTIENVFRLFYDAPKLATRPMTRFLADDIHSYLAQDLDDGLLQRKLHFDNVYYDEAALNDPEVIENSFRICLGFADKSHSLRETVFAAILTADTLWDLSVWPTLNALTEFILRRVLFIKKGAPALSFIPLSCRDDYDFDGYTKQHTKESPRTPKLGLDSTWLYAGQIRILLKETKMLAEKIQQAEAENKRVTEKIERIDWLNNRQKRLLLELRANPERIVTISDYSRSSKVAYATARQDLLTLEERGILRMTKHERAFCYRLSKRIKW